MALEAGKLHSPKRAGRGPQYAQANAPRESATQAPFCGRLLRSVGRPERVVDEDKNMRELLAEKRGLSRMFLKRSQTGRTLWNT